MVLLYVHSPHWKRHGKFTWSNLSWEREDWMRLSSTIQLHLEDLQKRGLYHVSEEVVPVSDCSFCTVKSHFIATFYCYILLWIKALPYSQLTVWNELNSFKPEKNSIFFKSCIIIIKQTFFRSCIISCYYMSARLSVLFINHMFSFL